MKRLVCAAAMSLLVFGCQANKPDQSQEPPAGEQEYTALAPVEPSFPDESSDVPVTGVSVRTDEAYSPEPWQDRPAEPSPGQVGTYVVKPKDTLYSIARVHYGGDHTKWRLIYQANQNRVADPDLICTGQKLIIPPQ